MSARCVLILTVYTLSCSGLLSPPSGVRLSSYNMDLVLRWDPPSGTPGSVLYTAQYKPVVKSHGSWRTVCSNSSLLECAISESTSLTPFGRYSGRVLALRGEEHSVWEESNTLTLDKETIIGPPTVSLISNAENLEVSITDPEFSISSLRKVYGSPKYNVTYWREGHLPQAKSILELLQNRLVLKDLEVLTNYCVQAQIHTEMDRSPSRASEPVCERTNKRDEAPWVAAVVVFVVMLVAAAAVGLVVFQRKTISQFLCPKVSLPQHFQHFLALYDSPVYQNGKINEEVCHTVIVMENGTQEEQRPLQTERPEEEQRPLQTERPEEEQRPLQTERTEEEQRPLQGERTDSTEEKQRPLQTERPEEEQRPLQTERTEEKRLP